MFLAMELRASLIDNIIALHSGSLSILGDLFRRVLSCLCPLVYRLIVDQVC